MMNAPSQLLKLLALLLDYPREDLRAEGEQLQALLDDIDLPDEHRNALSNLLDYLGRDDLLDVQAGYDSLFERGRTLSLLLFEHVHGESRDRGQAMVDLLQRYTDAGLVIDVPELPDYLPLYLEYLSLMSPEQAKSGLSEIAHILALLAVRLEERASPYASIMNTLLWLSGAQPDLSALRRDLAQETRDDSLEAIDQAWEEVPVSFNENAAGCSMAVNGRQLGSQIEQPMQWVAQAVPQAGRRAD